MLMIMQDQSRRLSEPLRWGRREKTAVAAMLSCVIVALAGIGVYALNHGGPAARKGCIELTFASTLGVAHLRDCGVKARELCASPNPSAQFAQELRADCRREGFRSPPAERAASRPLRAPVRRLHNAV